MAQPFGRAAVLRLMGAAAVAGAASPVSAAPSYGKPERTSVSFGVPVESMAFLPIYIAAAKTWKDEGLDVQLVSFRGDAEVAQALAGGSVDVDCASLTGLINLINSGQPAIGIYAGFYHAAFAWLAAPPIRTWNDLRGKTVGVSTFGSLPDALTRYVLRKHRLEPEKDVQLAQVGGSLAAYQALKAGRINGAILYPPFRWESAEDGMNVLGTQAVEIAPEWPAEVFTTKTTFVAQYPNTLAALLRGHVAALRLARSDRDFAVGVLMDRLKLTRPWAERTYDATMPSFNERGTLPDKYMPVFWQISVANGDVTSPWANAKLLDRRFVDTFSQWAPAAP